MICVPSSSCIFYWLLLKASHAMLCPGPSFPGSALSTWRSLTVTGCNQNTRSTHLPGFAASKSLPSKKSGNKNLKSARRCPFRRISMTPILYTAKNVQVVRSRFCCVQARNLSGQSTLSSKISIPIKDSLISSTRSTLYGGA